MRRKSRQFKGPFPSRRGRRTSARKGAAVVEAALCLPLIVILMLGTLEVCAGYNLKESLSVAAFEAVRTGVRRHATAQDVYDRAVEALADRNIAMETDENGVMIGIEIEPASFDDLNALDPIRVTITAETAGNSLFIFDAFANRKVVASVSMVREFDQ